MRTKIPDFEHVLSMVERVYPAYKPVCDSCPLHYKIALALYFLPHKSSKEFLCPTPPRMIKWYDPFAWQINAIKMPAGTLSNSYEKHSDAGNAKIFLSQISRFCYWYFTAGRLNWGKKLCSKTIVKMGKCLNLLKLRGFFSGLLSWWQQFL